VLKATVKRCVSLRLKLYKGLAPRMSAGKLFQMAVAECLKPRLHRLHHYMSTDTSSEQCSTRWYTGGYM